MNIPKINIPKEIWVKLLDEAKRDNQKIRAFGLFSVRRKRYFIKEFKEIEADILKESSISGPIFRFRKQKERGFYPLRSHNLRYSGTIIIQKNLDLTFHYAYWMGREGIDFNINLKIDSEGNPEYKAYWVDINKTDGEFFPIEVVIE